MSKNKLRPNFGLIWGVWKGDDYKPPLLHRILKPKKITGNQINGLGESEIRRPDVIYHAPQFKTPFRFVNFTLFMREVMSGKTGWDVAALFRKWSKAEQGPLASERTQFEAEELSRKVKEIAKANGADIVGITRMKDEFVFSNSEIKEKWVIMMGARMVKERVAAVPSRSAVTEVMRAYDLGHNLAYALADWLRENGWDAKGHGNAEWSPINMVYAALNAGLGELGKHGSIINRELGSSFRLSYVLTDAPLIADPVDEFGADDFCSACQVCTKKCPPQAISDKKHLVRGVKKWYVDFDLCVPFFNDNGGCGICAAVCPWNEPRVAENLIKKIARRRAVKAEKAAAT